MAVDTDAVAVSIKDIQDAPSPKKLNRSMTTTSIPDARYVRLTSSAG